MKPEGKQLLLTNKKASDGNKTPEVADSEAVGATPEEQYTAAYKGAEKANAAVGSALDRASFLLNVMEQKLKDEPTAQLKSSSEELKKLEADGTKAKNESLCGKLNSFQKECEQATKAMNQRQSHHRLWAKNAASIRKYFEAPCHRNG